MLRFRITAIIFILLAALSSCHTTKKPAVTDNSQEFYRKYSAIFGYELQGDEARELIEYLAGWIGTPYKYGGSTKEGTDCSGLTYRTYLELYKTSLYRSSQDQTRNCKPIEIKEIQTGDLVFFKISGNKVSHVGIYLSKNRFIHASTKKGVVISNLDEAYYKKYFYQAGRVLKNK